MSVERRPDASGRSTVSYPEAWVRRHGEPPTEKRALAAWLKVNHTDDLIAYAEGRDVPWLNKAEARLELIGRAGA